MKKSLIVLVSFVSVSLFSFLFFTPPMTFGANGCWTVKIGNAPGEPVMPAQCAGGAKKVIDLARAQIGKPYLFGGPQPREWDKWDPAINAPPHFDCSSLVGWAWFWGTGKKVNFPASTEATWNGADPGKFKKFTTAQKGELQMGDAIYWTSDSNIHHTALFAGPEGCNPGNPGNNCVIIEAQQTGVPVKESGFEARIKNGWAGFIRPVQ